MFWSSGGGVDPCVILSRCFWQHTSEIHSGFVLITAGLRFPPSLRFPSGPPESTTAEEGAAQSDCKSSLDRCRRLPPPPDAAAEAVDRLMPLLGSGERSQNKGRKHRLL
ncbi:hypothetical protein AMECASPLE_020384 [Ameca splendens]|uniref:Uncharacterized protein n=1 Tax=Ameca splendens TaxID=208324 RepID=A0ABV0YEJ2_9TELE